ncbi:O-succinylbenzoate synthase [Nocardiopsis sp. RSe5-2]|uniref:O-succinylbenzoate synthase n=1 Tax=Nocardiopsis endophytica TaxID=3018445 RepID=A0ABT4U267_9ACTN|nr:enolase C-terminal domain-like protein [Nocardiopsis endophytica]MDA2811020.1 O-succinylbenzoate synthase [Nocardiopsis endophytica]
MSPTGSAIGAALTGIEATLVRLPRPQSRSGGGTGGGRPPRARHALVRVTDDEGVSGWGEMPDADADSWRRLVEDFAPALLRHPWHRPTEAPDAWAGLAPCPPAAAALDTACWDLWSRRRSTPLAHALGGVRTAVTAGVTIGRQPSLESLVLEVNRQVGAGFRAVRLRIGPGWDLEPVRAVQESYPFLALQAEAGGRYTESEEDLAALRALDEYGMLCLEQPFAADDLAAHARLHREMGTPVALAASVGSPEALEAAVRAEAGGALNLSPSRLGGLTPARRAADRAADAGWDVWCEEERASGVGRAAAVALASLSSVTFPSQMPGAGVRAPRELVDPPVRAHDGIAPVPLAAPGLGHEVDTRVLRSVALDSATLVRARPAAPEHSG